MSTTIQKPRRRLIRELPVSVQPASRLARVGSDQLTITELIALVLNTADGLHLAEEIVSRFSIKGLAQTTLTELQELYGIGPSLAGRVLAEPLGKGLWAVESWTVGVRLTRLPRPSEA